jgi:hypothetical protein
MGKIANLPTLTFDMVDCILQSISIDYALSVLLQTRHQQRGRLLSLSRTPIWHALEDETTRLFVEEKKNIHR